MLHLDFLSNLHSHDLNVHRGQTVLLQFLNFLLSSLNLSLQSGELILILVLAILFLEVELSDFLLGKLALLVGPLKLRFVVVKYLHYIFLVGSFLFEHFFGFGKSSLHFCVVAEKRFVVWLEHLN